MKYNLDAVGMVIIDELKSLKKKLEKEEKNLTRYQWLYFGLAIGFVTYLTINSIIPYWNQYSLMLSKVISDPVPYFYIALLVTVYQRLKAVKKNTDKADKEYNNLRCEVIQRLEELWPRENGWEQRHFFLKELKDAYDINLYYEN